MSPGYVQQMQNAAKAKKDPWKGTLPAKYASIQDSGLVRTVTESGTNEFDFDLN